MTLLSDSEFAAIERLLAGLFCDANETEEAAILDLHSRVRRIYLGQNHLRVSRKRLQSLQRRAPEEPTSRAPAA